MRILYLTKTDREELAKKWGFSVQNLKGDLYVQCTKNKEVNWDKALVYSASELVGKENVKVIK